MVPDPGPSREKIFLTHTVQTTPREKIFLAHTVQKHQGSNNPRLEWSARHQRETRPETGVGHQGERLEWSARHQREIRRDLSGLPNTRERSVLRLEWDTRHQGESCPQTGVVFLTAPCANQG